MSDCEMEYKPILVFDKVLKQGTYNGYEYYIISMGLHPCAYIVIPDQYQDKINPDDFVIVPSFQVGGFIWHRKKRQAQ